DVPATVDVEHLRAPGHGHLRCDEVGSVTVAPDRVDGRMLDQQQVVVSRATLDPAFVEGALEVPGLLVRKFPKLTGTVQRHASSCAKSQVSLYSWMRGRNSTAVEPSNAR